MSLLKPIDASPMRRRTVGAISLLAVPAMIAGIWLFLRPLFLPIALFSVVLVGFPLLAFGIVQLTNYGDRSNPRTTPTRITFPNYAIVLVGILLVGGFVFQEFYIKLNGMELWFVVAALLILLVTARRTDKEDAP